MMLKLVNDISSIEATLRSNHTLKYLLVNGIDPEGSLDANYEIHQQINYAIAINNNYGRYYPEAAGKEKVIQTQLLSTNRAELCRLQEVDHHSVFSEIDPIHLPEVLSLIGERHGQGELYVALISSIMSLFSTMSREGCIQQEKEYYVAEIAEYRAKIAENKAKLEELDRELAAIKEAAVVRNQDDDIEHCSNKRRRT